MLAREPEPLGEALGEELRRDGIELILGQHATAARRDGDDYVLTLDDGTRTAWRQAAGGHRPAPRIPDGLDTVGVTAGGTVSRSTRGAGWPTGCGPSATSPASGC